MQGFLWPLLLLGERSLQRSLETVSPEVTNTRQAGILDKFEQCLPFGFLRFHVTPPQVLKHLAGNQRPHAD